MPEVTSRAGGELPAWKDLAQFAANAGIVIATGCLASFISAWVAMIWLFVGTVFLMFGPERRRFKYPGRKGLAFTVFFILLAFPGREAKAQFSPGGVFVCANCSDETTSLVMKLQQELSYAKQIAQYAIEAQQLADTIKQSVHGGPSTLTNITGDLAQLANVVQGGQALAYSLGNQDVIFRNMFPGYQSSPYAASPAQGSYQNSYSQWAQTSLATTQGILRGVGVQGKLLATEQSVLSVLRQLSASNLLDRNNAINLSGQLAAEQVGQLQKLRELQLEDMTSKAAFQGYTIQKDASGEQAMSWFFQAGPVSSDQRPFQGGDLDH